MERDHTFPRDRQKKEETSAHHGTAILRTAQSLCRTRGGESGWTKCTRPGGLTRRGVNWYNAHKPLDISSHQTAPGTGYKMKPLKEYPKDTSVFKKVPLLQICNITLLLENSFARVETASAGYRGRTAVATVSVPSQGKTGV